MCHRGLNLEHVYLRGTQCTLMGLTSALRIPCNSSGTPHMIEPQPPCAKDPLYVAPELLRDEPFDGYAVDLWSAGVMLFVMLLGTDSLFVAPVYEDKKFREICIDGNLRCVLRRRPPPAAKSDDDAGDAGPRLGVSDEAIDLLQGMLRADPKARMTLADVQQHAWVLAGENDPPPDIPVGSAAVPEA